MVGCTKGSVSAVREAPRCSSYTLLFAPRGVSCKNFTSLLDDMSMENFVQTRPRKSIFASLCVENGTKSKASLFYPEVPWLSCGEVLAQGQIQIPKYEIQNSRYIFLMLLKFEGPNLTGEIRGIKFRLCIRELRKTNNSGSC